MSTSIYQSAARPAKELPMTGAEREARVQLAAAYRIFDMLGWDQLIFNHITLRVPGPASSPESARFLINPFGLHYSEITASSLLLIDLAGNALRETKWPVNRAGFVIHSAIHGAVPEAHCVMHTHTTTGSAVACLKDGLAPDNFYGAMLHQQVAYHDFEGVTTDPDEKGRLVRDIGDKKAVILRHHGLLSCSGPCSAPATCRSPPRPPARLAASRPRCWRRWCRWADPPRSAPATTCLPPCSAWSMRATHPIATDCRGP
jgi:ribulose-5-phosphate 4-epimerase/fuculose-1-phosphate aldolase